MSARVGLLVVLGVLGGLLAFGKADAPVRAPAPEPEPIPVQLVLGPVGGILDKLPGYDTLEQAAVAAAKRLEQCSHYYECGGVIAVRPSDHKYVVGPLISNRQGDSVEVDGSVPFGWERAADFHSHPCLAETHFSDFFSPDDLRNAVSMKVISFMLDMCTGDVHEFDPAKDSPNDAPLPDMGLYATHGRIVGHIAPTGSAEPDTGI